jgi:predicted patatin/cPLA2 family phospholipase
MEFWAGATDIVSGEIRYRDCRTGDSADMQWLRASASMPLVSRPVPAEGMLLLDGGITEPTPFFWMEAAGYDRCVVILTQPGDYRKEKDPLLPLYRLAYRKYPALVALLEHRHENYNRHIARIREREEAGQALVIRPRASLQISHTEKDPAELERVYQLGRAEGEARLEEIRSFLAPGGQGTE